MARPRLVPFTSATWVPVLKLFSSFFSPDPSMPGSTQAQAGAMTKRVVSQMAKMFRGAGEGAGTFNAESEKDAKKPTDELKTGIQSVRALGDDGRRSPAVFPGMCLLYNAPLHGTSWLSSLPSRAFSYTLCENCLSLVHRVAAAAVRLTCLPTPLSTAHVRAYGQAIWFHLSSYAQCAPCFDSRKVALPQFIRANADGRGS